MKPIQQPRRRQISRLALRHETSIIDTVVGLPALWRSSSEFDVFCVPFNGVGTWDVASLNKTTWFDLVCGYTAELYTHR